MSTCVLRTTSNAEGALVPRPRPAKRPSGWAPSSIREVLHRDLYRGLLVWNKRKKRDQWGVTRVRPRPAEEWVRRDAPELRIVEETLWQAAHQPIARTRQTYLRGTAGQLWGRPANALPSLVAELQAAERRRAVVEQALRPMAPVPAAALARVPALLEHWRGLFRHQVPFARQALRVLFDGGRAIFTPQESGQVVEVWRLAPSIGLLAAYRHHKRW